MKFLRAPKEGFTLLEILIVISILAILIGVVIPKGKGVRQNADAAKARKEMQGVQAAVEAYKFNDTSKIYPPTSTTVESTYLAPASPRLIANPIPYDPFGATTTTQYNFRLSSNKTYYVIWSVGFDGTSQTTAISNAGVVTTGGDDICVTNGSGCTRQLTNACGSNQLLCSGVCKSYLTDVNNCGACGNVCGGASPGCCSGTCYDLASNANNCAACGNVCGGSSPACCSSACVDLSNDVSNCGSCGWECNGYEGINGDCCASSCVDPATAYQNDDNNCGSCGNVCPQYYSCDGSGGCNTYTG